MEKLKRRTPNRFEALDFAKGMVLLNMNVQTYVHGVWERKVEGDFIYANSEPEPAYIDTRTGVVMWTNDAGKAEEIRPAEGGAGFEVVGVPR